MAEAYNTLAGLVQMNDQNLADINVTNLLEDAPLLQKMFAKAASNGTLHKYLRQTVAAGAAFRAVSTGILNAASQDELVTETLEFLDASFKVDVALAGAFKDGKDAYMAKAAVRALKAAMASLEKQILHSTGNDANGFAGFPSSTDVDKLNDAMCIGAGGAGGRSVWLIRTGDDDVAVVAGNDGNVELSVSMDPQFVITNVNGSGYNAYNAAMGAYYAVQFGSVYSLGRIANLDGTSGHTLTDDLLFEGIGMFPASKKPNLIVMDRVLAEELRASRTTYSPTGAPAEIPVEISGIEIVITDQLKTNESTVGAS